MDTYPPTKLKFYVSCVVGERGFNKYLRVSLPYKTEAKL